MIIRRFNILRSTTILIRMYLLQYLFQLSCFLIQTPKYTNLSEFTRRHSSVETRCLPSHHLDSGSVQCSRIKQGIVSTPTVCWSLPQALAGGVPSMDVCRLVCLTSLTSPLLLQPCSLLRLPHEEQLVWKGRGAAQVEASEDHVCTVTIAGKLAWV